MHFLCIVPLKSGNASLFLQPEMGKTSKSRQKNTEMVGKREFMHFYAAVQEESILRKCTFPVILVMFRYCKDISFVHPIAGRHMIPGSQCVRPPVPESAFPPVPDGGTLPIPSYTVQILYR